MTFPEEQLIRDIVECLLECGLLYGEELKEYVYASANMECSCVEIRDYKAIEEEIHRKIDKALQIQEKQAEPKERRPKREIFQIDPKTNEVIATYKRMKDVEENTGIKRQIIRKACLGKQKTSGGYIWKYGELINKGE